MKFHIRAKYHINGRLPGFEYPYWELPEKPPVEAEEEAVMLIGGLLSWLLLVVEMAFTIVFFCAQALSARTGTAS